MRLVRVADVAPTITGNVLSVEHGHPERRDLLVVWGVQLQLEARKACALELRPRCCGDVRDSAGQAHINVGDAATS